MESTTLPAPLDTPPAPNSKAWLVALRVAIRDRTVVWLTAMFLTMVLVSAYLGWSATHTLDGIFQKAIPVLKSLGKDIPVNPASEVSPLSDLRNMTTYVSLLGALAAIVLGTQLIGADRKSGVFPLIASRPVSLTSYALGKILALFIAIAALLAVTAAVNALTMLLLPGQSLTVADWEHLSAFYGVSALCLVAFGLIGLYFSVVAKSESLALLIPGDDLARYDVCAAATHQQHQSDECAQPHQGDGCANHGLVLRHHQHDPWPIFADGYLPLARRHDPGVHTGRSYAPIHHIGHPHLSRRDPDRLLRDRARHR